MKCEQMAMLLIDCGIATGDEICLVTSINGENEKSYLDILYSRTGYRNFDQLLNEIEE